MKLARELASGCPQHCASLINTSGILHVRRSLLALLAGRKQTTVRDQPLPPNPPVRPFDSRAHGFSTTFCLARRRSIYLPPSPNLVLIRAIEHYWYMVCVCVMQSPARISVTVPPASRVPPPLEGHQIGARKKHPRWTQSSTN